MDPESLRRDRKDELLALLLELDELIGDQAERVKFMCETGLSATSDEELLRLLQESRQSLFSAIEELLGNDFPDAANDPD